MAAVLVLVAATLVYVDVPARRRREPLHHEFANKAAAVDGEMFDVVGNMPVVFGVLRHRARASPV